MHRSIFSLAGLWHKDIKFVKVFRQQNRSLAENLGVRGSPTVLFFKDGHEVGQRLSGGIKRADLARNLEAFVAPERVTAINSSITPIHSSCDVLVLGAGPSGLTAGIYTAQAKLRTVIVDTALAGGNLSITHQVSNYPGFPKPIPGWQLADHMATHAKNAGCTLREAVDVTAFNPEKKEIVIDGFETISARYIILATGNSPKLLGIPGEKSSKEKVSLIVQHVMANILKGKKL